MLFLKCGSIYITISKFMYVRPFNISLPNIFSRQLCCTNQLLFSCLKPPQSILQKKIFGVKKRCILFVHIVIFSASPRPGQTVFYFIPYRSVGIIIPQCPNPAKPLQLETMQEVQRVKSAKGLNFRQNNNGDRD